MTKRRKVDASKFMEAVRSGRLSQETINSFALEKHGLSSKDKVGRGRGRRRGAAVQSTVAVAEVTINKRGILILPRELVTELGFKMDDAFVIRKTRAGMILKPRRLD